VLDAIVARRIRLVGLDVDGVLTDGGLYLGQAGGQRVELKRFHSHDGMAVWLLREAGLGVAIVSGRASDATTVRARELGIEDVIQDDTGAGRKLEPFERLLAKRGLELEECAFMGDDLADLPLLSRVGLPVAVANAVPDVKSAAAMVTRAAGGHGAVREFTESLLKARGVWERVMERYLKERGDVPAERTGSR